MEAISTPTKPLGKTMNVIASTGMLVVYGISSYALLMRTLHGPNHSFAAMVSIVLVLAALILVMLSKAMRTSTPDTWTGFFRACWFSGAAMAVAVLIR